MKDYFEQINIDDGLSSNIVKGIIEDKDGFIWFGTSNGLNRYDGKNISVFQNDPNVVGSISDNHISTLFLDKQGVVWAGTMRGGLCRYRVDGTFDIFKHNEDDETSISNNQIWCIYEDTHDNLWVGTQTGLNRMNRETGTFKRFVDITTPNANDISNAVLSIVEDKAGRIWIGTWSNGLYLLVADDTTQGQTKFSFLPVSEGTQKLAGNNIWSLHTDSYGRLWVGVYHGGLFLMNPPDSDDYHTCAPEDFTFTHVNFDLNAVAILSLSENDMGELLVAHNFGLSKINLNDFYENSDDSPYTYFYFLGSVNGAFNKQVNNVFQDSHGLIWIAHSKGVHKYFGNQLRFEKKILPLSADFGSSIASFYSDKENNKLWIGIASAGILMQDLSTKKIEHLNYQAPNGLKLTDIRSIYKDDEGVIWLGSRLQGAMYSVRFEKNKPKIKYEFSIATENTSGGFLRKITKATGGKMWIVGSTSILLYDPKTKTFKTYLSNASNEKTSIKGEPFDMIHYDDNTNWVATAGGGLHKLTWQGDSLHFKLYQPHPEKSNTLKSNILYDIELVGDNIWIASESGIQKYNIPQDSFYQIPILDRRINGKVLSITQDKEQRIWFSNSDGLFCYNSKNNILSNYNADEGLPLDFEFRSSYTAPDGRVYFGGIDGYVDFMGSEILRVGVDDAIQITDLKILGKSIVVGQKDEHLDAPILQKSIASTNGITLSPKHNVLTIEYSVLDYIAPNQYEYTYMLEGFDKHWNFVGKKTAVTYTNLNSGNYTFRVKARGKSGTWTAIKTLEIEVLTPYWKQGWFIFSCFIIISIGAYMYMNYREYNILETNEKLEALVKKRTEALKRNIKELKESEAAMHKKNIKLKQLIESNTELEQFAHAVAHDLKQPIRSIEGFSSLLKRKLEKKNVLQETEKEFFRLIKQGVLNMDQLITGLLEYSKISAGKDDKFTTFSTKEIILTVKSNLSQQIEESRTNIVHHDIPPQIYGVQIKLMQLLQNLISNSIKFRKKDQPCIIKISAKEQHRHWLFRIEDNGIGIPPQSRSKVFQVFKRAHSNYEGTGIGLATCKRIIQQHSGDIWVDSEFTDGTIFYFYIQKQADTPHSPLKK